MSRLEELEKGRETEDNVKLFKLKILIIIAYFKEENYYQYE